MKFYFSKFMLPNEEGDRYRAIGVYMNNNTVEDLVNKAVESNHGMPKAMMLNAVNLFLQEAARALQRGECVTTSLFNARPIISGVFDTNYENVDTTENPVKIRFSAGTLAKEAADGISLQRLDDHTNLPQIFSIQDSKTNSINDIITPANILKLTGSRTKLALTEEDNGIFLIDELNNEHKLDTITLNTNQKIIGLIPSNLTPGEYKVELRTSFSGRNKPRKSLKVATFYKTVRVE